MGLSLASFVIFNLLLAVPYLVISYYKLPPKPFVTLAIMASLSAIVTTFVFSLVGMTVYWISVIGAVFVFYLFELYNIYKKYLKG